MVFWGVVFLPGVSLGWVSEKTYRTSCPKKGGSHHMYPIRRGKTSGIQKIPDLRVILFHKTYISNVNVSLRLKLG